ncbi:MAG TPA: thioesterase family protein [bacterium]|nr:thioesterase family protein [bacterium]
MRTHEFQLRVRYEETDQMGVAYYGKYLTWFEVARTELMRACGTAYTELEKKGIYLPVVEANCRYEAPLTYDDLITIQIKVRAVKNASIIFDYEIRKDLRLIAAGMTAHAFINKERKPVRVPDEIRKLFD